MWELEKEFRFEASHQLAGHDGKCARLHGHSWVGRVIVRSESIVNEPGHPKNGMAIDYADLKKAVTPLIDNYLDHWHLNDSLGLENPTSETVAKWIFDKLLPVLPGLHAVVIHETCTSRCSYFGGAKSV